MTSKTKFLLVLKSVLCFGFISTASGAKTLSDKSPGSPYYSNFKKDVSVHVYSQGKDSRVLLIKGNTSLLLKKVESAPTYTFEKNGFGNTYSLYAKGNKVGVLVAKETVQHNEESQICKLNKDLSDLVSKEIKSAVEKISVKSTFADDTCEDLDPDVKDEIVENISNTLNPSTAYALKCLQSEAAQSVIKKSEAKTDLAFKVTAKYRHEIKQLEDGNGKLKIACTIEKTAKFDPATDTISLPIQKGELVIDRCKNTSQVLAHEMFHKAGLSQTEAAEFDKLCAASLNMASTKIKECGINVSEVLNPDSNNKGTGVTKAVQDIQKSENKNQQVALNDALKNEQIKVADFTPVQDSDIKEITNPSSPSTYQASVDRVSNAMSTNMEKMAAPLNRAIASTVSTARADTTTKATTRESISKTTIANLRQPAFAKANGNEEYVVEEILADKYNVPVETIRAASVAAPSNPTAATASTRTAAPTTRGTGEVAATNAAPGGGGEIASGNSGGGGGGSTSSPGGVAGRSVSAGTRSNSRLPASTGTAAGADPLLDQLGQFNEVRGQRYRQIQERYDDPTFEPELKAKNIAIEYRQNNKTTTIGDTSNTRTLFRDDGTVLKKVTGAR